MTRPVQVAFRTSGGSDIGFGHVRRCMSLAMSLQEKGADCLFLLDGDPEVFELVLASGFQLSKIHLADDLLDTRGVSNFSARARSGWIQALSTRQ